MSVAGAGLLFIPSILYSCNKQNKRISGAIVGANSSFGHALRDGIKSAPGKVVPCDVLVVGAGIAGLSAARYLQKNGVKNVVVLEMNDKAGGNSMGGENKISAYPWGAHYLPLPHPSQKELIDFLSETGIITGFQNDLPVYREEYLNFEMKERLFIHGGWQRDLLPEQVLLPHDKEQLKKFSALIQHYKTAIGKDGKEAFCIPLENASEDEEFRALDKITMKQFLLQRGFTSEFLEWYTDYCCKDDFGTPVDEISAYAGIYYFAARKGKAANADHDSVLTWPEGNYFLVKKLQENSSSLIHKNILAHSVQTEGSKVKVKATTHHYEDYVFEANQVVMACPSFIAKRILKDPCALTLQKENMFTHSVWMIANISISLPLSDHAFPMAWDNVIYQSKSLGYVNACHQNLSGVQKEVVLTYYYPVTGKDSALLRNECGQKSQEDWVKIIVEDLSFAHPEIEELITNIDVWIWGHAMVKPLPFLFQKGKKEEVSAPLNDAVFFAHSDYAGVSNFEEAFYQGLKAAKQILNTRKNA
jgi:hypothetical protein